MSTRSVPSGTRIIRAMTPITPTVVEVLRTGRLELGRAAGDHRDRAVAPERLVDQLDAPLLTDVERDQHLRERDRVAEREHPDLTRERARAVDGDVPPAGVRDADLDHGCDEDSLRMGTEWTCVSV